MEVTQCDISDIDVTTTFAYLKASTPSIYRESVIFLTEPKKCALENPQLNTAIKKVGKGFQIEVSCARPAFWVSLDSQDIKGIFSDNMFSIRPTAQKVVTFTPEGDEDISVTEFSEKLRVYDLYWAGY